MKLLVVGNSYMTAFAQRKYVEMKRQCSSLELRILAPRTAVNAFRRETRELAPGLGAHEVVDIREFFGRSHMTYVFDPFGFAKALREFEPDRVHIEEDPYSAVGVETVFLTKLFCPSARISFFIWDNLARVPRFPLGFIKRTLNRYSLRRAELVVCGNKEGARLLREKKGYRGRVAVLPQLGLDPDHYVGTHADKIRDDLLIPANTMLIGFVGRLVREKGISLLFEALRHVNGFEWRVLVMGAGPMEGEIAGKWREVFGERLIFRPAKTMPRAEVPAYISALDVLVLPSYATPHWKEQFGIVLAQAMLAGVPCVGSSSGAIPEVIGPGGLVFGEKDADDLARTLERILTDAELRKSLAANARNHAQQHYTHETVGAAYLAQFGWAAHE